MTYLAAIQQMDEDGKVSPIYENAPVIKAQTPSGLGAVIAQVVGSYKEVERFAITIEVKSDG